MILGSTGYIGRNLARLLPEFATRCGTIINCAGKKDILWCEQNPAETYSVNAVLPAFRAKQAKTSGQKFVHIGSDHAYCNGPQSQTVYAQSKRLGDDLVMAENPDASIIVTGHVYANDCPWIQWLDKELSKGRQVVAYTNRICSPTWIGDLAEACRNPKPGVTFVLGQDACTRLYLFRAYASVFEYNQELIHCGEENNPLLVGDSGHESDVPTAGIYDGFRKMKGERDANRSASGVA